jgi:peptidoglycan/LPS O-acetylase OafA/YrhL
MNAPDRFLQGGETRQTHPDGETGHLRALTGIRGIAALAIVLSHAGGVETGNLLLSNFIQRTYLFVDLFFVLSGVVMAMTYTHYFTRFDLAAPFARFMTKRFARIYPLYFVIAAAVAAQNARAFFHMGIELDWQTGAAILAIHLPYYVQNFLLVQAWGFTGSLVGPAWSISTEAAAYLLFPALLWLTVLGRRHVAVLALIAACALLAYAAASPPYAPQPWLRKGALDVYMGDTWYAMCRCLGGYTIGLLLYRVGLAPAAARVAGTSLYAALAVAVFLLVFASPLHDLAVYPSLVLLVFFCKGGSRCTERLFGNAAVHRLGLWSYSLYLLHVPLLSIFGLRASGKALFGTAGYWTATVFCYAALIGLAALTYRFIELPAKRRILASSERRVR